MASIFSQIVDGEIPARVVYEDETTMAFLDANPLAPGHTLVIPKAEHERLNDLPDDLASDLYDTLHRLIPVIEGAVDAPASNVAFNNGEAAGQEVPHVHGHIIPRFEDDGGNPIHAIAGSPPNLDDEELDDIAERISTDTRI
ncbi:HIT family protein [Halalkalicoccus jeotgali]|uniref:Histidine triad (HIT) protein n=1 Tax=Halalkalicoccus jeotgali (strain DSM 18796 / CECT 7217 / JCM 14584 / KCTC 4019 / B3) TaxID=795797 RepID=D8J3V8_HALJB|nr:HIT family protein [Halalkalicoccus jeotgali]ADJ13449.1 histidine triad (HIT) protein [Halalkalicoccus jeotgali B3]ELY33076.1 histidine triad (HIT) protein [Halalkalicoccus jeotgali B3]